MSDSKHVTFTEACQMVASAAAIIIDGHFYEVAKSPTEEEGGDALVLRRLKEPDAGERALVVWFSRTGNAKVGFDGKYLVMVEEYGDSASLRLVSQVAATKFTTAETAAALMDAIHSEVCRQSEGSDSAYAELYEVAQKVELGFPGIWSWVATLAEAAASSGMEAVWAAGEAEFIECVQVAAQEFHNFITDPRIRDSAATALTRAKAESLWRAALLTVSE